MNGSKKRYSPEFKSQLAVEALRDRYPVSENPVLLPTPRQETAMSVNTSYDYSTSTVR